jgi:cation transport ATPase
MLSGGQALENYALRSANSSVLAALAKRMPSIAHRKRESGIEDVALREIAVGDTLVIHPHEICPVDGVVIEGHGVDGRILPDRRAVPDPEDHRLAVLSGAINGESALTIRTTKRAADSRYAKIMEVMRESEAKRPQLRRLGDRLGAIYTPVALTVAILAWAISGESVRFLAVLVIATPCPLLIAIPIAIIGSISLCARRAIIVKNSVVLEQIAECRTAIFDKTGTLTYGAPKLTEHRHRPGLRPKGSARPSWRAWSAIRNIPWRARSGGGGGGQFAPKRHRGGEQPGQGFAEPFPAIKCGSPAEPARRASRWRVPISFPRLAAGSSAWWRSTGATRRPCASGMRRARRAAPS